MPVVDDTIHTLEIKAFKKEVLAQVDDLKKRVDALEKAKGK